MFTNTLIGKTIGQYRIISEIGRGGMAIVYKAEQAGLNRFVALKVLFPNLTGDSASVERLQREARAAAGLDHPNIVDIYEVGEQDGLHYIAMKFAEGRPLDVILAQEKTLPPERILRILAQIASALDYAHRRNLVHRDIKPSNILVGPGDRVLLTDFGLVKALDATTLTSSGALVGTPIYMSPEQARGLETDYRADIYSVGVICYEMLAGRPPFQGNPLSIILAHASQEPPPLRTFRPDLSPQVEAVVRKALAKEPAERYTTVSEFVAMLRRALLPDAAVTPVPAGTTETKPPATPTPMPRASAPARRTPYWAIGIIALILVVAATLFLLRARPYTPGMVPATASSETFAPGPTGVLVALASPTAPAIVTPTTQPTTPPTSMPSVTQVPSETPSPTHVAPTSTAPAIVMPTSTPTQTASPSPTAMPTSTPTPTASATATLSPAPTSTFTASPSPTKIVPTPVPRAPVVTLTGPADGQVFATTEMPVLSWTASIPLAADEQFVVVIDRKPPPPHTGIWHDYHMTRGQSLTVPRYLAETTADGRFEWYVQVMRSPRIESGQLNGELVGKPSPKRTFMWPPVSLPSKEPSIPLPTPTRDD